MFRLPSLLSQTRTCIWRLRNRPDTHIQAVPLSISPLSRYFKKPDEPERDVCPPKPPVIKPPRDDRLLWGIMSILVITGSFCVYAKQNQELRDYLTLFAPWLDDLVALLYQENMTYKDTMLCVLDELEKYYIKYVTPCIDEIKVITKTDTKKAVKKKKAKKEAEPEPVEHVCVEKPKVVEDEESDGSDEKSLTPETSVCDELAQPFVITDICQIEECMWDQAETSVNNYYTANAACAYFTQHVESVLRAFTLPKFKTIEVEKEIRDNLLKKHICKAEDAEKTLDILEDELYRSIRCNVLLQNNPEKIEDCKNALKDLRDKVAIAKIEYQWTRDRSNAWDQALPMISKIVEQYMKENQAIYQKLNYCDDRPRLYHDLDWLLHHTKRYVEQMMKEVKEANKLIGDRIDRAIEMLPGSKQDKEAKSKAAIEKGIKDLEKDYSDRLDEEKKRNEDETKMMLAERQKKFEENLDYNLEMKEKEAQEAFKKKLEADMESQKQKNNEVLKEINAQLEKIQAKYYEHIKADRERNRSRALYAAAMALLQKCKRGDPIVPVEKEIDDIEKNRGICDELITAVMKTVPDIARRKGVVPESVLKSRYRSMESTALRVAMVESEGSPLFVYFLSLLQSFVLFMKIRSIPQEEKDNPPQDIDEYLDTFDLLQRSRYYMDHDNMAEALRYVGALKGASRSAAARWYDDAKVYLEIRQLAEIVVAHATAIGLKYMG